MMKHAYGPYFNLVRKVESEDAVPTNLGLCLTRLFRFKTNERG